MSSQFHISKQSLAWLFAAVLPLAAAITDPVRTESGQVSGIQGANPEVRVYKGIPFAAPPVGDLRWKSPKPATRWEGVRAADKFSAVCMQGRGGGNGRGENAQRQTSEDCLYVNIYTAAHSPKDKRPVMVWIYGGALTAGAGSIYDGEELAKKGVVVVTFNYRLGVFGFFAHPELTKESDRNASGNYGLMDQLAALEWVQRNIAAFGGDVKRVTIFGESAGSWSTNMLMASPLAHGLFQRVIGESGAEFARVRKLADAEQAGVKFGESVGAPSLAALRTKSAEELQAKSGGYQGPDVDGYVLPEDVYTIFSKGKQNDVPLLLGSNADEGTMFTPESVKGDSFRQTAQRRFGDHADEYLKLYPFTSDTEARRAQANSMRDQTFGWEMRTWARMETKTGKSKAYLYYFSKVPPGPNSEWMGAYHSSEIQYVFNNVNGKPSGNGTPRAWTDSDRKLADLMSSYWVNFATAGDPNGKGLLKWPVYKTKDDLLLHFGDNVEVMAIPHKEALDFLDENFERQRKSADTQ
jgi:para-nitrobenzyl esterase